LTQLLTVALDDKYVMERGRVFMTGIQALVRLPMDQIRADRAREWGTAGYVTGYRGSPLGAYDQQLQRAKALLDAHGVIHQPGVNEDLAATACQGTQQVGLFGPAKHQGVFAIWYGKGPGVDRSGDAFRHGNLFGAAEKGGVLLLLGDDHICESSTTAHQSEYAMVDAMIPVLNPSGVQEILEYGLAGIALSRFSGAWVALKCIHDTVESTGSIEVDPDRMRWREPEGLPGPAGRRSVHLPRETPLPALALERARRLHTEKMEAARAWVRANGLDRIVLGLAGAPLVIVTTGKSWQDVVAALDELDIDEARAASLGLAVYKVALVFPLEPRGLIEAIGTAGLAMVVEEKRPLIEDQAKAILYDRGLHPKLIGKRDEAGAPLFPSHGALDATSIALAIARRLAERTGDAALGTRIGELERRAQAIQAAGGFVRMPWFCPGCPHNTSTKVPDGSRAVAGIGCHFMASWMDRNTAGFTQMGGEGASWLGEAPFSEDAHVFQNIGDGTFYHSGSLAVRAAVAAGQNVTFKVLYNDAVAMTGGQKMETANLTVPQVTRLLEAEGVKEIAVVTDEPDKYPLGAGFPHGVRARHRDELDAIQRRLRAVPGVTAIVYDQTCAAEKRRRRKKGEMVDPDERIVINELVCEGCGDCGVQSNCVAIQPVETELGRKRRIDQSACNKDFSCLKGFCPSFVSVKGGVLKKGGGGIKEAPFEVLPEPALPELTRAYPIVVTGIGGTGVITVAALLGMAAHLEGKGCVALDMLGLAQKGGAVVTYLKLAPSAATTGSPRVAAGSARLVLGCDLVVAAGRTALPTIGKGTTRIVASLEETMTGAFTTNPDLVYPTGRLAGDLRRAAGNDAVELVDAARLAARLLGDAIGANLLLVGFAWQRGLIPLSSEAIAQAIEVNGVAVAFNKAAFLWGRRAAHDLSGVQRIAGLAEPRRKARTVEEIVEHRATFLEAYQDAAYAARYRERIGRVRAAEAKGTPGSTALAEAAARSLFKLMAIKDEYEVARLWTDGAFLRQLGGELERWDRLEVHLAPPLLARRDAQGHLVKQRYGPWMFRAFKVLARLKGLRGTPLDIFGRTAERRMERRLLAELETFLDEAARTLTPANHAAAVALAELSMSFRGFGHVKETNVARAQAVRQELLAAFRGEAAVAIAAE